MRGNLKALKKQDLLNSIIPSVFFHFPCAWTAQCWSMCKITVSVGQKKQVISGYWCWLNKRTYHVSLKADLLSDFQLKAAQRRFCRALSPAKVFVRWLQAVPLPVFMKAAQHQEWEQRNAPKVIVHCLSCSPQLFFYYCLFAKCPFLFIFTMASLCGCSLDRVGLLWEMGHRGIHTLVHRLNTFVSTLW